jgi:CRP/FNR family cyclic AMP-dependent transcriptional regulator
MDHFSENEKKILKNCSLLKRLSDEIYNDFLKISYRASFETNTTLLYESQESDDFFIIISGSVGLYKNANDNSAPELIEYLSTGQTIGEMRVIQNRTCSLTVKTTEPTIVLRTSISELCSIENHQCYQSILESIINILNERLFNSNQAIFNTIKNKRRRNKQLIFSLFCTGVLILFLCELGFALYYAMNLTDLCNTVKLS